MIVLNTENLLKIIIMENNGRDFKCSGVAKKNKNIYACKRRVTQFIVLKILKKKIAKKYITLNGNNVYCV